MLPLTFEANRGQTDPEVKFVSRGSGYTLFLTRRGEAVLVLRKPAPKRDPLNPAALVSAAVAPESEPAGPPAVVRMKLVGGNAKPQVEGLDELPGKANYFIGNNPKKWRTNVPTYARVKAHAVYPGVDLVYYGTNQNLEHDFIVAPGADPGLITIGLEGAEKLSLDTEGNLVAAMKNGEARFQKPVIYQEADGVRREISGGYVLKNAHHVGFQVVGYDVTKQLIIDPALFYSTYLGGTGNDHGNGIAVDSSGNAYVIGETSSSNFPTTSGTFQPSFAGGDASLNGFPEDAFVTKLNPTGSALIYSTYLGGSANEAGVGIAVDSTGSAYVTGLTDSTNFPTTPGAFQTALAGGFDAFVTRLSPTGSGLVYSTYLGGSGTEEGVSISLDSVGSAYLTGNTNSSNFPTTSGAFQTSFGGGTDAFVTKLNGAGSGLVYSSYLGGSGIDLGLGIAIDSTGSAYVSGGTDSTNFPTTFGAFQTASGGGRDAFVVKLNPAGAGLVYSTYLGGSGNENGYGIALDSSFNAYVTGFTDSTNFPTTLGAFQTTYGGGANDVFVTKLNAAGSVLVYSTYLGGSGSDASTSSIAVDSAGSAYVTGSTDSTNFPTVNPIQAANAGGFDAFVTKLNAAGSGLVYSTYLGGSGNDFGGGPALDSLPNPNVYVTGGTSSINFPTTSGAFQTTFGGGAQDAFVVKIANIVLPPGATSGKVTGGGIVNVSGGIANFGFIVQTQLATGQISGDLQYVNHASGAKVHSVMFTTFTISGNTATFSGTCTNNGAPCTFSVMAQDNGEPGTNDMFTISINGGPPEGGTLRSGNIQIHK